VVHVARLAQHDPTGAAERALEARRGAVLVGQLAQHDTRGAARKIAGEHLEQRLALGTGGDDLALGRASRRSRSNRSKKVDIMSTLWHGDLSDAATLAKLKRLARLDRIVITAHANQRMGERGTCLPGVRRALLTATTAFRQADRDNWRVEGGVDNDGDALKLICDIEADVIVVTLF